MSDQNTPVGQQFDGDREEWPAPDPEELRRLQERLAAHAYPLCHREERSDVAISLN